MELARKTESRFLLKFMLVRSSVEQQAPVREHLDDLNPFFTKLESHLSPRASKVLKKAQERYAKYQPLLGKLVRRKSRTRREPQAKIEARRIKAIVDFETSANREDRNWTFKDGGLTRLVEDFYLVSEYFESQQSERFKDWCLGIGKLSLSKADQAELDQITDVEARKAKTIEKVQTPTEPLWMFFVALCHALQEDDNELTATDAYWLGLVDEVLGDSSLLTTRWFAEYVEDKPAVPAPTESGKVLPEKADDAKSRS